MTSYTAPRLLLALALCASLLPACTNECGAGLFELCPSPATDSDPTTSSSTSSSSTGTTASATTTTSAETVAPTTEDDTTTTARPYCGDGELGPDEECDDGEANADDAACTLACALNICGDGLLFKDTEECDDGEANADDAACTLACALNICGDGLLFTGSEECDDNNTLSGDGCTATCQRERYVFVSSVERKGNGGSDGLKGLLGADALCQELAQKAGLTAKSQIYMAWLSTTNQGPSARFPAHITAAAGPFKLINNSVIASSWSALLAGPLLRPIDRDELNQSVSKSTVWTNTTAQGTPAGKGDCDNWNSFMGNPDGGIGYTDAQDAAWTNSKANDCASSARLYCFQVNP